MQFLKVYNYVEDASFAERDRKTGNETGKTVSYFRQDAGLFEVGREAGSSFKMGTKLPSGLGAGLYLPMSPFRVWNDKLEIGKDLKLRPITESDLEALREFLESLK